jgi:predicted dehydrogenase
MRASPYGILLVTGSHSHQEIYAPAFAADPRCRLVAVTDERDVHPQQHELNERLARAYGIPYLPDLDEALARLDVQVVSICAPPERRGRIAVRCALAGKHLYLDKSLAPRLEEADAVVAAVLKTGVRSHMFTFITQPWAQNAKKAVEQGGIGRLLAIHAELFFAKGPAGTARLGAPRQEAYPPQRHQLREAKRELDNSGVYPITLVRWLTGLRFRTIFGVTGNYFFQEHQRHDVEDFGLLACTLEDGMPVTIATGRYGWCAHPAAGVHRTLLVGSEGTLLIDVNRPRLEVYTDEAPWLPPPVHQADPMGFWNSTQAEVGLQAKRTWMPIAAAGPSDASYFLDCLDAGRESEMAAPEAALATEVLLAGYQSAASGEVVTLPLPRESSESNHDCNV